MEERNAMHGLHLITTPVGTYKFVGAVPAKLAYDADDETIAKIKQCGPGMFKGQYRDVRFDSAEEAWTYAESLGYSRCDVPGCACAK